MAANQKDQRNEKGQGAPSAVKLSPSLTLANAGEVKVALQAALAGAGKITVDATAVTEVDIAGLQLICATHRAASRARRELEVVAGLGGARCAALTAAIGTLGFGRDVGCGDHCLCREVARG
jgi:ABC-type transporter Mla MlaB component